MAAMLPPGMNSPSPQDPSQSPPAPTAQGGANGGSLLSTLLHLLAGLGIGEAGKLFKTFTSGGKSKGPNGSKGAAGQPNSKVQVPAGAAPQQIPPQQLQALLALLAQRQGASPSNFAGQGGTPPQTLPPG